MKNIAIIILNYNTWELTIQLIKNIREIDSISTISDIVVVDNASTNNSKNELGKLSSYYNYKLIENDHNDGYAAGNNIGLRYAYSKGYQYAFVVNNDIIFDDKDILTKLIKVFSQHQDIAVVSPDIHGPDGYLYNRDRVRPTVWDMTLGAIAYKKKGRGEISKGQTWCYAYRPQGCCMLVDLNKLKEVDFLDEHTFLYCEEIILAERLLKKKYRCACCVETSVIHNHSYTVKKSLSKLKFIKINLDSFNYYLKEYRRLNILKRFVCNLFYILKLFVTKQV